MLAQPRLPPYPTPCVSQILERGSEGTNYGDQQDKMLRHRIEAMQQGDEERRRLEASMNSQSSFARMNDGRADTVLAEAARHGRIDSVTSHLARARRRPPTQ